MGSRWGAVAYIVLRAFAMFELRCLFYAGLYQLFVDVRLDNAGNVISLSSRSASKFRSASKLASVVVLVVRRV